MTEQRVNRAKRFEDLKVWQKAHELCLLVYRITKDFPPEEKFGLVSQMRRAAVSVAANLAEGFKRRTKRDKAHFYNTSQSSLEELRYYFILSKDLGLRADVPEAGELFDHIGRMLNRLIDSLNIDAA